MKSTIVTILICGFATVGQAAVVDLQEPSMLPAPDQRLDLRIAGTETDVYGASLFLATDESGPVFTGAESPYWPPFPPTPMFTISEDGHEMYVDIGFGSSINLIPLPDLLVTLIMDATGVGYGDYNLHMSNNSGVSAVHTVSMGDPELSPGALTFSVTPEPASLALLGIGLLVFRRRGVSA